MSVEVDAVLDAAGPALAERMARVEERLAAAVGWATGEVGDLRSIAAPQGGGA